MRFRLLRRRFSLTSPRVAVRSAMPWMFRWVLAAVVLGFCAAIALWAFEFGKDIAGLDGRTKEELVQLRAEVVTVKAERDKAQSIANTSETILTAEKAAHEEVLNQNRLLMVENAGLRSDLGFFETLIPTDGSQGMAIRGLQAAVEEGGVLRWQVLVMQPAKKAAEFSGKLDLTFTGLQNGKPWIGKLAGGARSIKFKQYSRFEGVFDVPPQTVVQTVSAKILDGSATRAEHTVKL